MENKYYTPSLKEFHFGFEFEFFNSIHHLCYPDVEQNVWYSTTMPITGIISNLADLQKLISDKQLRVKHLDRDDCESLGWQITEEPKDSEGEFKAKKFNPIDLYNHFELHFDLFDNIAKIECHYQPELVGKVTGNTESYTVFEGTVNNKSEFRKLMQMIGI